MPIAYLATVGSSEKPAFNSIKAVLQKYKPEVRRILLLCSQRDKRRGIPGTEEVGERIKAKISGLPCTSGVEVKILRVSQESIEEVYNKVKMAAEEAKRDGLELWVDITGGRKTMSSGALLAATELGLKCFYFWLYDPARNRDKELEEMQEFIDYEVVRVRA